MLVCTTKVITSKVSNFVHHVEMAIHNKVFLLLFKSKGVTTTAATTTTTTTKRKQKVGVVVSSAI